MNSFKVVLGFELREYFRSKGFIVTTLLIAVLAVVGLSAPRFMNLGFNEHRERPANSIFDTDYSKVVIYDRVGYLPPDELPLAYSDFQFLGSEKEVAAAVEEGRADQGFVISGPTSYKIYVYNSEMFSDDGSQMSRLLSYAAAKRYASEHNMDFEQLKQGVNPEIKTEQVILGKDTRGNYWYCYALVIIIFMMIIMYGQMIATSVTTEKSNRSIEVLVTTTSPNSLLFGKVIAGAIASLFQMTVIICAAVVTYRINREYWGGMLDLFLNIPTHVLVIFLLFGLFGYLFYAFIYGAIGALVSKTEDISKSASGVMMLIMVVYFVTLFQLSNPDGIVIKVLSFLPVSSYSAMFARVALGTVSIVEIILSFAVLVASVFLAGFVAAKIYRMGTLRYGNPIKLGSAIKAIKKKD